MRNPLSLPAILLCLAGPSAAEEPRYINPPALYDASKYYSHVIVTPAGGRVAYIAGQVGVDASGAIVAPDMSNQIAQAFKNLRAAIDAAGARPESVVKISAFFVDYHRDHLTPFTEQLHALFPAGKLPTSTVLGVQRLARDGLLFEIEAVAHLP
jgi:enamine deaminase RidA (YjgF/YER057c/UK114 family)